MVACAFQDEIIYVTRNDGSYSFISYNGISHYISSSLPGVAYISPILISPYTTSQNSKIHKFYAWTSEPDYITKVDYDVVSSYYISLGFIPTYGYCKDGFIYLFGNGKFVSLTDPILQPLVFNISFIPGGGGVYGNTAYFM